MLDNELADEQQEEERAAEQPVRKEDDEDLFLDLGEPEQVDLACVPLS